MKNKSQFTTLTKHKEEDTKLIRYANPNEKQSCKSEDINVFLMDNPKSVTTYWISMIDKIFKQPIVN